MCKIKDELENIKFLANKELDFSEGRDIVSKNEEAMESLELGRDYRENPFN